MSDATTSTIRMNQQDHLLTCSSGHLLARENREFAEPEVTLRLKIVPWHSVAPTIPHHMVPTEQFLNLDRVKPHLTADGMQIASILLHVRSLENLTPHSDEGDFTCGTLFLGW